MNDDARLERLFEEGLADLAPARAPDRLRTNIKVETGRGHPRPRWLALIKEPPMRTSSRLAVGSPTMRVAAIVVATLLIAAMVIGASFAGASLFAADGEIVVDQTGNGDYTTITEAVAAATDGDEILVRPGTYTEAVIIEADITLRGDGPVEDIVIEAPEDGPTSAEHWSVGDPYAILVLESDATVSGFTFRGTPSAVILIGGSPTLENSVLDDVGRTFDGRNLSPAGSSIVVADGSSAVVSGNTVADGGPIGVFGESVPRIEGNTLTGGPHIFLNRQGEGTVVKGNTIDGTIMWGIGVFVAHPVTIEGNIITNPGQNGINFSSGVGVIQDNVISGAGLIAIAVGRGSGTVAGNKLTDNGTAIGYSADEGLIEGNIVERGGAGIVVVGKSPLVKDNVVRGVEANGITIGTGTSPTLIGNTSCDNGKNLVIGNGATPQIDDSNDFCGDAPAE